MYNAKINGTFELVAREEGLTNGVNNMLEVITNFNKGKNVHELFLNSAIDYDKIIGEIRKVEKNSSDLIKLANSNSTKTLKKLLTEKKIPICERKNLPVFADDNGIIWCYKVGSADRVKIDKSTKTVLYFKTEKTGENINYGNY